jgi:hypothetical protein
MWPQIAIFAFGLGIVLALLVLIFKLPHPTPFQYVVMRVLLALASAAIATMLTGFLDVEIPNFLKAGGALAVFVVVYFKAPAALDAAVSLIQDNDWDVGERVMVRSSGQQMITIPQQGVIAWTPPMKNYRGQVGEIRKKETIFGKEKVFRLSVDNEKHEWHQSWLERYR